jgi:amidophosphoribosyltransferase
MAGIFGVYSYDNRNVLNIPHIGIRSLQPRGQESAGISVGGENSIRTYRGEGHIINVFNGNILKILDNPSNCSSIGHVRKSKVININNIEPVELEDDNFKISVVMDGKLFDQDRFKEYNVDPKESTKLFGKIFLKYLIETRKTNKAAEKTIRDLDKGYFSVAILVSDGKGTRLIIIRDPRGMKPYCIGRIGKTYLVSSESVAFNSLNAELLRDVKPGEFIEFNPSDSEPNSEQLLEPKPKHCAFEYIYYANRASIIEGKSVDEFRKEMGRKIYEFYKHFIKNKGKVIPSRDSGVGVGLGFAQASGFEYDEAIIKNPYSKRTFIIPDKKIREFETSLKFIIIKGAVENQILFITEDSIVRGTVSKENTKSSKKAGAEEIHYVVSAPPLIATCPDYIHEGPKSFIASKYRGKSIQEIGRCVAKEIGANSVMYPTVDMIIEAIGLPKENLCLACFTGKYPVEITF